jgi:hypothetical protein
MKLVDKILKEAAVDQHYIDRLYDRILNVDEVKVGIEVSTAQYQIVGTYTIPENLKTIFKDNIAMIESYPFPKNKSYGVKVLDINIDRNKVHYNSATGAKMSFKNPLVIVDETTNSNGNVVYAIIRQNKLETIYFGKSYVPQTTDKMRVDAIVKIDTVKAKKVH